MQFQPDKEPQLSPGITLCVRFSDLQANLILSFSSPLIVSIAKMFLKYISIRVNSNSRITDVK